MGTASAHGPPASPRILGVSLKMYFDPARATRWARQVVRLAEAHPAVTEGSARLFVLPSVTALESVGRVVAGTDVALGAQDLFWEDRGPYTGGVSGADLRALGCRYVEVGHMERRVRFGEDDEIARRKFEAALRNDLAPVVCVGERSRMGASDAATACRRQLHAMTARTEPSQRSGEVIVAYEPEWAIGGEEAASPAHIREVARSLRSWLTANGWGERGRVIYGGSAQPGLLPRLGGDVDGLFLGRFAHDVDALSTMLDETRTAP